MANFLKIKVTLIGSESCGKSAIVGKYLTNEFKEKYQVI